VKELISLDFGPDGRLLLPEKYLMAKKGNSRARFSKENLIESAKDLADNAQDLLKATASAVGEKAADSRAKVQESLLAVQDAAKVRGRQAIDATHEYVHENPWNAVGIAAGVGILIGAGLVAGALLLRRRD